jgi:hypothetical protein
MLSKPVFAVGEVDYRWEDVLLAAHLRGQWRELERRAAVGLACASRAKEEGDPVSGDDLDSAARSFRYERDLLSADELEEWLGHWDLTPGAWIGYIHRALLRTHWADQLDETLERHPPDADELVEAIRVEAVCSGALREYATTLAAMVAASAAMGEEAPPGGPGADPPPPATLGIEPGRARERLLRLRDLEAAYSRFCERALTERALDERLAARGIDWLRIEGRMLSFEHEGMAREAALLVRDDGMDPDDVGTQAGRPVQGLSLYLEDAEPFLKDRLMSAGEGEVVGPLQSDGRHVLVMVERKVRATLDDPGVRERAAREVKRKAVDNEMIGRVRWHETSCVNP